MIYAYTLNNARRFFRITSALPSAVFRALRTAGAQDITAAHDYASNEALQCTAAGYDIACRTEVGQPIPQDEQNAREREREEQEPATLAQVEAAFSRLMVR